MPIPLLAAAPKVGGFLLSNWRFALPVLLVGWAMYERNGWQGCERDWQNERLQAEKRLLEQKTADAARREEIQGKLDDAQEALRRRQAGITERIIQVPVQTACRNSPAIGISNDGLQSLGFVPQTRPSK